mgnify:CR=1 FL=1
MGNVNGVDNTEVKTQNGSDDKTVNTTVNNNSAAIFTNNGKLTKDEDIAKLYEELEQYKREKQR